jgi:beta-glucanase (GH16 family)
MSARAVEAPGARRRDVRRVAAILVLAASLTWGIPARVNAAEPIGWRPLFSESFDEPGVLPSWCTANDGRQDAGYFRPDEVRVSDGMLRLDMHRRSFGGAAYTTGGLRCEATTQQYGRYEFSARVPPGAGIASTALLEPVDAGAQRQTSTMRVLARPGDEKAYLSNGHGDGETTVTVPGAYSDGFHTYLIEWAPSGFRAFVDGQERLVDARVSIQRRWFGFAVSTGDGLTGQPDAQTALPAELLVDYVRVWAYDPAASPSGGGATRSTVDGSPAAAARVDGPGRSIWLAVAAGVVVLLAGAACAVRRRRSGRLSPGHRA